MKSAKIKEILRLYLPLIVTAVILTMIQAPVGWSVLAWVSLVPFILVCRPDAKPKALALAAYLISLFYWLGNLYWMAYVTPIGWIAFCVYTAVLWPIVALCLRWCRMKKVPLFLAVPVLIVGAERLQGLFLGGFFWRFLAHSQYENVTLIQIADIFGAGGVSFLIAMVNGLAAELIIAVDEKRLLKVGNFIKTVVVIAAVAGAFLYGRWRLVQSAEFIEDGPLVDSLQSNVPQSVKQSFQAEEEIFTDLLEHSKQSAEAGAELIVWPETMVQAILEPRLLRLLDPLHSYRIFDKSLSEHAKEGAFLLVGAYGGTPQITEDFDIRLAQKYNSAFLYKPDGSLAGQSYGKIHLVPFGEALPFKNIDFLHNLLIKIGYEDAVPALCRRFAVGRDGRKRIDWLINISNDGWFVRFKDGKVLPSTELAQHTAVCVFRAVENRLAIVRSVNTGISCLIDPLGYIHNGFMAGNLPYRAMARQGCAGWFVDRIEIDKRTTFFSKYGQWLDFCCAVCLIMVIIVPALQRLVFREGTKK